MHGQISCNGLKTIKRCLFAALLAAHGSAVEGGEQARARGQRWHREGEKIAPRAVQYKALASAVDRYNYSTNKNMLTQNAPLGGTKRRIGSETIKKKAGS